jgi:hypothetical protein
MADLTLLQPFNLDTAGNFTFAGANVTGNLISGNANLGNAATANYFIGNGSLLTGIAGGSSTSISNGTSNVTVVSSGGNITIGVDGTGNVVVVATTGQYVTGVVSASGNVTGGNVLTGGLISATGTITGSSLLGSVASTTGNITGGNILTGGLISSTGTITSAANITGGNVLTGGLISATGNVTGGNLQTSGSISTSGNITGGNLNTTGITSTAHLSITGNIIGNLVPAANATQSLGGPGQLWKDLYLSGTTIFIGDQNFSSNATAITAGNNFSANNLNATNNITSGNTVSATGNVTGGNISTGGLVQGGNVITDGLMSAGGNVTGSNVLTNGLITAGGNVTGGNLLTGGLISATGQIISVGNITTTGGFIFAAGTISAAANVLANGIVSATGDITAVGNVSGNAILTGGYVSATGNITGGNLIANASVVTANIIGNTAVAITTTANANIYLQPNGTGNIVLANTYINSVAMPEQDYDAATKLYVDNAVTTGFTFHEAVAAATTTTLATATGGTITYSQPNGAANGVGAKLTTTGTFNLIDSANIQTVGTRVLVKNEANAVFNGVYVWANATNIVRSLDADQYGSNSTEQIGLNDYFFVDGGNVNAGAGYIVSAPTGTITFGTSNITFAEFSRSQVYTANTQAGVSLAGTVINAKVDNVTTAFDAGGNISVKASANLTTPNIGAATGTSLSITGNVDAGNVLTDGLISATGNATVGNLLTDGLVSVTANVTGGNLLTGGVISASSSVFGSYIYGNGSQLSGLTGANVNGTVANATYATSAGSANSANTANTAQYVTANAQANITSVGVLTSLSSSGNVTGSNLLTGGAVSAGGDVTAANFLSGGFVSVTGNVTAAANISGGNLTIAGATSTVGNIVSAANISGNYILGNGAFLTGLPAGYSNANVAAYLPTYTGNLVSLTGPVTTTANVTGNYIVGNGSTLTSLTGANVTGTVANATYATSAGSADLAQYVTANAQANITSVGTLTALSVTGNTISGNLQTGGEVSAAGNITGSYLIGNGSALTSLTGANVTGTVANATYATSAGSADLAQYVTANAQANITSVGVLTALSVSGNIIGGNLQTGGEVSAAGNITGSYLIGNGSQLTGIVSSYGNANVANYLPTYTGNLISLTGPVSTMANVTSGNLITGGQVSATGNVHGGNLISSGSITAGGNVDIGANYFIGNGALLSGIAGSYSNATVANYLPTYTGNLVSLTGPVITTANVTGNYIIGDGSLLTSLTGANVTGTVANATYATSAGSADLAQYVTANAQANITSVGILTSLSSTGNITGSYIIGNGSLLTSLTGANVTGTVANATYATTAGASDTANTAQYVTANAQANITSVGVLTSLSSTGNITGSYIIGNGSLLSNLTGANVTGTVANATYATSAGSADLAQYVTANAQANITSVGTLTALTVTGNVDGGNVLTGGQVSAAGNVTAAANVNGGNLTASGLITATGNIFSAANVNGNNIIATTIINAASVTGTIVSVSGNVTGGNILTGGAISATGTITSTADITAANVLTSGLVSAAGNVIAGNVNTANIRPTSGALTISTGTGNINLNPAGNIVLTANTWINNLAYPAQDADAATKLYVDNLVTTGVSYHESVYAATNTTLATATGGTITYAQPNGAANGIGATLTTTGSFDLIDTANVQTVGTRILVKNEANAVYNGIYVWSNITAITRSSDADTYGVGNALAFGLNDYFFTTNGNVNQGTAFIVDAPTGTLTFGTSNITFAVFSQSSSYSANASAGLELNGTTFSAKVDNITTAFDGTGNIVVKASANLTTPNIGAATGTSLSVTGNVNAGNLRTAGLITATGNITGGNISTAGQISATGNVTIANSLIATGNATTGYAAAVLGTVSNVNQHAQSVAILAGNANGAVQFAFQNYSDLANASTDLAIYNNAGTDATYFIDMGIVSSTYDGDAIGANVFGANDGYVYVAGNSITGPTGSGANVGNLILGATTGQVITWLGNTSTANIITVVGPSGLNVNGIVSTTGNILSAGNIIASKIISATDNMIITSSGSEGGQLVLGWAGISNIAGQANSTWNMDVDSSNTLRVFYQNATSATNVVLSLNSSTNVAAFSGNVSGTYFIGNGSALTGIIASGGASIVNGTSNVVVAASGNVTVGVAGTSDVATFTTVGMTANSIAATNNATGFNFRVGDDAWIGDINVADTISIRGQQNAANGYIIFGNADSTAQLGRAGSGPLTYNGAFSAAGNVTGSYFIGNGSLLTGISGGGGGTSISNGTSDVTVVSSGGNVAVSIGGTSNVAVFATTGEYVTGLISASGNVIANNGMFTNIVNTASFTGGIVSVTGNVQAGNLRTTGLASVTGNVTGGNILTGGLISATGRIFVASGNVSAPGITFPADTGQDTGFYWIGDGNIGIAQNAALRVFINTTGIQANGVVSATGNITGGNILTAGLISATANVTGGNIITAGSISASGNINVEGNVNIGNADSVTWANASGIRAYVYYNNNASSLDTVFL